MLIVIMRGRPQLQTSRYVIFFSFSNSFSLLCNSYQSCPKKIRKTKIEIMFQFFCGILEMLHAPPVGDRLIRLHCNRVLVQQSKLSIRSLGGLKSGPTDSARSRLHAHTRFRFKLLLVHAVHTQRNLTLITLMF